MELESSNLAKGKVNGNRWEMNDDEKVVEINFRSY